MTESYWDSEDDYIEVVMNCYWNVICEEVAASRFGLPKIPGWTKVRLVLPEGIKGPVEDWDNTAITARCDDREERVTFRDIEALLRSRYEDLRDPDQAFTMELTFDNAVLQASIGARQFPPPGHEGAQEHSRHMHPKLVYFVVAYRV